MLKNWKKWIIVLIFVLTAGLFLGNLVLAQDLGIGYVDDELGLATADPRVAAVNIIRLALTFLGIIAIIIIIYGGFLWMTSAGDPGRVEKAKKVLLSAVIGLIIILSAFLIVSFIINRIGGTLSPQCDPACTGTDKCCTGNYCCGATEQCCNGDCCGAGQCCISGFCQPCGTPSASSLYISSTYPPDNPSGDIIRNVRVRFNFNTPINVSSVILGDTIPPATFSVTDSSGNEIEGSFSINGRQLIFEPLNDTCEGSPCANRCFPANETITINAQNIWNYNNNLELSGMIDPNTGFMITCGSLGPCTISFNIGDVIDCQDPIVNFESEPQVCIDQINELGFTSSDDNGVAQVSFSDDSTESAFSEQIFVNPAPAPGSWDLLPPGVVQWQPTNPDYIEGINYTITITAEDVDTHSGTDSQTFRLRAAHCCNGDLDADEIGTDCGGADCAACDGAACGVSLEDDCEEDGVDCTVNNNRCASGLCECGGDTDMCLEAGYASGIDDCCICESAPVIDWITPIGGFCLDAGGAPTNDYCLTDTDCGGNTCDMSTSNGAEGNLITIGGRSFGTYEVGSSRVLINGIEALLASAVNTNCTNSWTSRQIIVVVPGGMPSLDTVSVEVIAANGNSDTIGADGRGPEFDFLINSIIRPGICRINPDNGIMGELISYEGIRLEAGTEAYFGNMTNNTPALTSIFLGIPNTRGSSTVPNINSGRTTTFVSSTTASNYLEFRKNPEIPAGPYIISFEPTQGSEGQYVTIMGSGFGNLRGASRVYFDQDTSDVSNGNETEADYDFPDICADSVWSDNQIIVKVPDLTAITDPGNYYIVIDLQNWSELISTSDLTPSQFYFDSSLPLAPSLCRIRPVMGPNNSDISLWGEYFDAPDGNSIVRFHLNNDQVYPGDISFWGIDGDAERIDTRVHLSAVTGPVIAVKGPGGLEGNGINFRVGNCTVNDDCGSGGICCPSDSISVGRCAVDIDDCYANIDSAVYEWDFSTEVSASTIGTPCYVDPATTPDCNPDEPDCGGGLICDSTSCTCQMPCDDNLADPNCNANDSYCLDNYICDDSSCFCVPEGALSCVERSRSAGRCPDGTFCQNSPGQCSFNEGEEDVIVGDCSSCDGIGACDLSCTVNTNIQRCINGDSCDPPRIVNDVMGNGITAYCVAVDATLNGRWQINTTMSCPEILGIQWIRDTLDSNYCYEEGTTCSLCESGFSCYNDAGGVCAVNQTICPSGSSCDGANCIQDTLDACECCCRMGQGDADCCEGLECAGSCGTGGYDENDDGDYDDIDDEVYGYCSGCRVEVGGVLDQVASDEMCNCSGATGKYCDADVDVNGDTVPDGICRDCGQLRYNAEDCTDHSSVCCVDARDESYCRGGGGNTNLILGDIPNIGYCTYYDCQDAPNNYLCDGSGTTTGRFSSEAECITRCSASSDICDLDGIDNGQSCDFRSCFSAFDCFANGAADPDCGYCCCDMAADPDRCTDIHPSLFCSYTDFPHCNDPTQDEPPDEDDFGVCCGCDEDAQCGDIDNIGCGNDTCCYLRPNVMDVEPDDEPQEPPGGSSGEGIVCRNALITAEFDQMMSLSSFSGNVIVVGEYDSAEVCPEGTTYLALDQEAGEGIFAKLINKIKYAIINVIERIVPSRLAKAYTDPSDDKNYCAITGAISGYHDVSGVSVMQFSPFRLLDGDRLYYVIIRGDEALTGRAGVRNIKGITMNGPRDDNNTFSGRTFDNAYIWSFRTLSDQAQNSGVCTIDHVDIRPSSYLFTTVEDDINNENDDDPNDPSFDTVRDSDKVFVASAISENNQELVPVQGYAWEWHWDIGNRNIVDDITSPFTNEKRQLVDAQPDVMDGRTNLYASVQITQDNYSAAGNGETGTAEVYVFLCDNPWPPIASDGTWLPWQDTDVNCTVMGLGTCHPTNYEIYYCRDSGRVGTYDDLPAIISGNTIVRGEGQLTCNDGSGPCLPPLVVGDSCGAGGICEVILKEAYYFREDVPGAEDSLTVELNPLAQTGGSVILNWAQAFLADGSPADGYNFYWDTTSGGRRFSADIGDNTATTTWGLENGVRYYFNVTAYTAGGAEGEFYGEVSILVEDIVAPDIPTGLTAVPGDSEVELSWNPNDDNDTVSYIVYRGSGFRTYGLSGNVGSFTSVSIPDLTNGVTYHFAVKAVDASGNLSEDYSDEVSATPSSL